MPRVTKSTLEFPYSRTVGPVVGAFFTGLREHRIVGIRSADGKVFVPPLEYDPNTGDALTDLGDHVVGQPDQVPVVYCDAGVWQRGADAGGIRRGRVDDHELDPGPKLRGLSS